MTDPIHYTPIDPEVPNKINGENIFVAGVSSQQKTYNFTNRVFPEDLGEQGHNGHIMVININVSDYTKFDGLTANQIGSAGNLWAGASIPNGADALFTKQPGVLSNLDYLRGTVDPAAEAIRPGITTSSTKRRTTRIAESIALYMPASSGAYTDTNIYEDISLTGFAAGIIGIGESNLLQNAQKALQIGGRPINPRAEMFFSTKGQRQNIYDFRFAPANEEESKTLEQIIFDLRFHAAPEVGGVTGVSGITGVPAGLLSAYSFVAPAEFDLTFYQRIVTKNTDGNLVESIVENTRIPRVGTSVLTNITIDYAPDGIYSTFSNGYPVQCRMQLSFTEIEIIHKLRVTQGF